MPPTNPPDPRRAELALELEWLDVSDAYVAAKAAWVAAGAKPRTKEHEAYLAAKKKMSEMRTYWRRIGEAVGSRTPVGANVVVVEEEEG